MKLSSAMKVNFTAGKLFPIALASGAANKVQLKWALRPSRKLEIFLYLRSNTS
jgi:hypothetical protein